MRKRLAIFVNTLLLLCITLSFGQENTVANLLENGDFEGEFIELEGADPRMVAASWTPWHVPADDTSPSFANHSPNYDEERDRIRLDEAGKAQKYFTLFATHQGGIYQEVDSLTSGSTYRFSVYAYVWSSSFEDTEFSEDPGDVVLRVGIDPNGGTDGASDDIIWSTAATFFYDAFRQYAVIATAESSSITVFVESTVGEPRANNYIYLDDAVLEAASETVVVVDDTPTQETGANLEEGRTTETPQGEAPMQTTAESEGADDIDAPEPEGSTPTPTPTATPDEVNHIVEAGDTVGGLADEYGTTVQAIREANSLNAASAIFIGQILIIPINVNDVGGASALAALSAQQAPSPTATATPSATPTETPTATTTPTPTFTSTATPTATPITHQILPGDALVNIARRYGTTVELLAEQNGIVNVHQIDVGQILVIPSPIPPSPTPTEIPTATAIATFTTHIIYIVQIGDTLDEIAREHGTTIQAIVDLNGLTNPRLIVPGQELEIPSTSASSSGQSPETETNEPEPTPTPLPTSIPVTYTVQSGDTLSTIAALYGLSIVELAQLNGISNFDALSVGQVLIIPG
ncbi:MAG: LysM peptidoglycan-binding domain-containing protein [Chloroflexota bacterium]|nr:LysM peptidoglycan-binding domain-containing protein [Chloroflexota bacterium]